MSPGIDAADAGALQVECDRLRSERDDLRHRLELAQASSARWRRTALEGWDVTARAGGRGGGDDEAEAMRRTLSWRITRPLRAVRLRQLDATRSR